jgi:adenosylmethionine-8-amino-7-oxononanoate aminotransferase
MSQADNDHVFYRSQSKVLPEIDRGQGIYFFDQAGKRYIDGDVGCPDLQSGAWR